MSQISLQPLHIRPDGFKNKLHFAADIADLTKANKTNHRRIGTKLIESFMDPSSAVPAMDRLITCSKDPNHPTTPYYVTLEGSVFAIGVVYDGVDLYGKSADKKDKIRRIDESLSLCSAFIIGCTSTELLGRVYEELGNQGSHQPIAIEPYASSPEVHDVIFGALGGSPLRGRFSTVDGRWKLKPSVVYGLDQNVVGPVGPSVVT